MEFKYKNALNFTSGLYKKFISSLLIFTLIFANMPVVDIYANAVVDDNFNFDLGITTQGSVEN